MVCDNAYGDIMEIYLDLENTLLNAQTKMNKEGLSLLKELSSNHPITILTTSPLASIPKEVCFEPIRIVSTLENKMYQNGKEIYDSLKLRAVNKILKSSYLYTAYTIHQQTTYVIRYQERLKFFYPTSTIKCIPKLDFSISFIVLVVAVEGENMVLKTLKDCSLKVLAKDKNRVIFLVTSTPSTKEAWLKKLKKSPAIGIGDSLEDYEFIQHCEIQVAMQNGDQALLDLCPYHTAKSTDENGALQFIQEYLKLQQV